MAKEIPLTQGKVALVDDADYEYLAQFKWYAQWNGSTWYAIRNCQPINGKRTQIRMHRLLLEAPPWVSVDHANHNSMDNRRENLRLCSDLENNRNVRKRKDNESGYKGVRWHTHTKRWQARITVNGKLKSLGYFSTAEDAARRYDAAALEYFGEFACVNGGRNE